MREIKFRAWDDKDKKWLLGYEYPNLGGFSMFGEVMAFGEYTRLLASYSIDDWKYIKLMQFTGLKENAYETGNKEIYEGDIIEFINGERLVVEWNDDTCKFQYSDGSEINDGKRYGCHKMIVGNVYENHELIK